MPIWFSPPKSLLTPIYSSSRKYNKWKTPSLFCKILYKYDNISNSVIATSNILIFIYQVFFIVFSSVQWKYTFKLEERKQKQIKPLRHFFTIGDTKATAQGKVKAVHRTDFERTSECSTVQHSTLLVLKSNICWLWEKEKF